MSQADITNNAVTPSPATGAAGVRGAIARAAQATGVDFNYLLAQARLESSLDPQARATGSSAAGLYQFTKGTWGTMLARHGATLGVGNASSPSQLLALRNDPNAAAMMAAQLAGDNTTALTTVLGRAPTSSELYLAHFLGTAGATRFLGALAANPDQSAAALLPKAAAANSAVFFDAGGAPRSVGAVMALVQTRMDAAMQDAGDSDPGSFATAVGLGGDLGGLGAPPMAPLDGGPIAGAPLEPPPAGTSMSDTLRDAFGLAADGAGTGTAPAFVRSAYDRMQALGL